MINKNRPSTFPQVSSIAALSLAALIIDPVFYSISSDGFGACFTSDVVRVAQWLLMSRVLLANTPKGFRWLTWHTGSKFWSWESAILKAISFSSAFPLGSWLKAEVGQVKGWSLLQPCDAEPCCTCHTLWSLGWCFGGGSDPPLQHP